MSEGCDPPAPKKVPIEPVSPELALVDPSLAARLRASDHEPLWVARPQPAPAPLVEATAPPRRRRARQAYLVLAWVAVVLTPVAALATVRESQRNDAATVVVDPARVDPLVRRAESAVERALPAVVPGAAGSQPNLDAVLDPATGLLRTGTAIRCRLRATGLFTCVLSAPRGGRATETFVRRTATGVAIVRS